MYLLCYFPRVNFKMLNRTGGAIVDEIKLLKKTQDFKKRVISKMISYNLMKVQPSCLDIFRKMQQLNFSVASCFLNKVVDNRTAVAEVNNNHIKAMESESFCLQPIPKKNYGLSTVEEKDVELVEDLKKGNIFYPYKNPYERCGKILLQDMKCNLRKLFYNITGVKLGDLEFVYFPRYTDILIVGGGILGLTIAYTIKEKFPNGSDVIVVDKDINFPPLSLNLGQALITHQLFTDEEEIPILKYGAEFFSSFSNCMQMQVHEPCKLLYEPLGSLVLVDNFNLEQILNKNKMLRNHEIFNKVLDSETLKRKFPWLNTKNILFGSLGMSNEGLIDPWAFLCGLKKKCLSLGVTFVTAEVIDFGFNEIIPCRVICKLPDGTYNSIDFSKCVLACGMEALNLTEILNLSLNTTITVKLPLQERMKYEYCFYNSEGPGLDTPLILDSSGVYFRREGLLGHYVAGVSLVQNADDEENDPYHVFHNKVKPFVLNRIPQFKELHLVKGWIDLHEFCISNEVGILGCHPEMINIIYALGFSHLGMQHTPAVARAVMESIFYEEYQTIDFASFHVENLWRKQHVEAERKRRELLESKQRFALPD